MKKTVLFIFIGALMFSCDNPVSRKINEAKEVVSTTTKAVEELNNMQGDIEKLQEIEPLTNAELKEWLPEKVRGMKRISFKAGEMSAMKVSSIEAIYANDDKSKKFKIEVVDGSGHVGASMTAGLRMLFAQDFEEETEYKIKRTIEKEGVKIFEEYKKDNSRSLIQLMEENRFFITATGTNMDIDETWKTLKKFNVDDLD